MAFLPTLIRHRALFSQLVRRSLAARYRMSVLGGVWAFVTPLLMLLIYTFVFCEIFGMRWNTVGAGGDINRSEFALNLFAGMLVYGLFAECLANAPQTIVSHVNYVKKVVFPLELLPLSSVCASLIHALAGLAVLVVCRAIFMGGVPFHALAVFPALLPLLLMALGLGWFLAALGVYARDTGHLIGILLPGLMFLSPVFYPASRIPEKWRFLFSLNPLTTPIEQVRSAAILDQMPQFSALWPGLLLGLSVAFAGYAWFQKTRSGFADVL